MHFPSVLRSWLGARQGPATPTAPRRPYNGTVLRVEQLEGREVPAAFTWTDGTGNGQWNNSGNWTYSGTSGFGYPTSGDDVTMTGSGDAFVDNVNINSLTMSSNYSGTLHVSGTLGISSGGLKMDGGSLSEDQTTATIGVNGDSEWSGGSFLYAASSVTPGVITFNGVNFNVNDGGGTSRVTEQTINLTNNAKEFIGNGPISFKKAAGITIDSTSQLNLQGIGGLMVPTSEKKAGTIENAGTITVNLPLRFSAVDSALTLNQSGGLTWVKQGTFLFTDDFDAYAHISGGTLKITSGASITGASSNPTVTIDGSATLTTDGEAAAIISGGLSVLSGTIDLNGTDAVGELDVILGNFYMASQAHYEATVDETHITSDLIEVDPGSMTLDGTLDVTAIDVPAAGTPAGKNWVLLTATGGRMGTFPNTFTAGLTVWYSSLKAGVNS